MYTELPAGQHGLCQMWSGDAINAPYYLPEGTSTDILRYWFPPDGKGEVDNDLVVCLAQGKNPVAAHFFINDLLDPEVAGENFGYTGYQPPLNQFTPDTLVADGLRPREPRAPRSCKPEGLRHRRTAARAARGGRRGVAPDLAGVQGRWLSRARRRARERPRGCWPLLAAARDRSGCAVLFVAPLYVVLRDPLRRGRPDLARSRCRCGTRCDWDLAQFRYVLGRTSSGRTPSSGPRCCAPSCTSASASVLCLLVAYPVAYYIARFAGRRKGLLLAR